MSVFIAISVVDTFALVNQFEMFVILASQSLTSLKNFLVGCKMMNWISTLSQICSSYFVLLFTIERFISVRFPLKRAIICTKRRINIAIVSIVVGAALTTAYELYYYENLPTGTIFLSVQYNIISTISLRLTTYPHLVSEMWISN